MHRELGWEKSYNPNIGLDAEFFKGNVNLTVDISIWASVRKMKLQRQQKKYNAVPGDIKLQTDGTFNSDGKHPYGANDRVMLGSEVLDWTVGLQNNFKYKNFDASL